MASIFTRIEAGEQPGEVVYRDSTCFAIMTTAPMNPGHVLLIPKVEVDYWIDLPADIASHLFVTAQKVSRAIQTTFNPGKVALVIVGLEVRHVHLHLVPISHVSDVNFDKQDKNATAESIREAADKIRKALS